VQGVEAWIRKVTSPERVDSASLRYEEMAHQAPRDLCGVYRPYDVNRIDDWIERTLIFAYLDALGTRGRILDIGTGDGWPALPIAPQVEAVVGIDLSPRRVQVSEENRARLGYENVRFMKASGEALPFPDRSFDGVVAGTSIEQMDDPRRCFAEIRRVLVPGGAAVITVEHLPVELAGPFEEEVEFFQRGESFCYRYTVKEADPPREAEYELILSPHGETAARLSDLALRFPVRPGFVRRSNSEPGAQPLTGKVQASYGLTLLEAAKTAIASARGFELQHFTQASLHEALTGVGFSDIAIHGRLTRLAHRFLIALMERDDLTDLAPHFETLCASLAQVWPLIHPQTDRVLFVRARRGKHV
jgi:ubiquinone/menaquinone biosynthesis C-methylase UbiE